MAVLPVRKIATAGVLSAVAVALSVTRLGMLPWFAGASLTIMHVPVVVAAVLEGPLVGGFVGLVFGVFSMVQATLSPNGPVDLAFSNPLVSVLPRILVGPAAYFAYRAVRGPVDDLGPRSALATAVGCAAGGATNTVLVLGALGLFGVFPWPLIGTVALANGPAEAAAGAVIGLAVVSAWKRLSVGPARARLADEEGRS